MPRTYKRIPAGESRRREYCPKNLQKTIEDMLNGKYSSYEAASEHDVPRGTLARHVAHFKRTGNRLKIGEGRPLRLSHSEESLLVTILQTRAAAGFAMDKCELLEIIGEYLPNVGREYAFPGGKPGRDWYENFMKRWRNELSLRKPELLTLNRALACNKPVVDAWFTLLSNKLTQLGLTDKPSQIFNCDESGLSTNPGMSKIITKRAFKKPVQVIPGSGKEQFTILALASATQHYPPFVVFAGKNLYDVWMAGGPDGALYGTSENGWMDTNLFTNWFKQGFLKWTKDLPRPLLLVFDGHISHISLEVVNIAMQNQVYLLCLPPHCLRLLQPLDVGVFKPLKDEWKKIIKQWYKDSRMKHIEKSQFTKLLRKLYACLKPQLAVFAKCGIYPFDPTVIANDKLAPAETFDKELEFCGPNHDSAKSLPITVSSGENENTTVSDARRPSSPVPGCSRAPVDSLCTPLTGMKKAVLAQLKVCNAAVRQKTARRKIAKQFGGECLTEEESLRRLSKASKRRKTHVKKQVLPAKLNVRLKRLKSSRKSSEASTHPPKTRNSNQLKPPTDDCNDQSDTDIEPLSEAHEPDYNNIKQSSLSENRLENCGSSGVQVGDFVKVVYDFQFYPAEVTAVTDDLFQCNCMESAKRGWKWPAKKDELWYSSEDIVKKLGQPVPISARGVYKFEDF